MLALLAYVRYTEMPRLGRYLLVMLSLALSLLAKPMLVTLPGLLLLLDYWPLRRWRLGPEALPKSRDPAPATASTSWLLLEKLPLLALSIASSIVTLWAQHRGGAVTSLAQHPLEQRLANAIVSYAEYLRQTAIPGDLAVFYPLAGTRLEIKMVLAAGLLIAGMTVLALRCRRRYPYLAVGWLWYLVSLIPVIGLVQVGSQARADRYTYLPLIGIFLLLTWGLADLIKRWRCQRLAVCPVGLLFVYFMLVSYAQAQYWEDSVTLWKHALLVTGDNYLVQTNLGEAFLEQGDVDGAIPHLEEALRLNPRSYLAHYNRGLSYHFGGKPAEAIRHYQEALRLNPNHIPAHLNLGNALLQQGKAGEAVSHYREAVRLDPGSARVHASLGSACMRHGDLAEAVSEFQAALRLDPGLLDAYSDLGLVFQLQGEWEASVECFRRAIALEPGNASLHRSLAFSLHSGGHADLARMEYQESLRLDPDWPRLAAHEAWSLATSPDSTRRNGSLAVQRAAQALQASGKRTPELLDTLAAAYAEAGQFAQAVTLAREARSRAAAAGRMDLVEQIEHRLRLYEQGQPFHAAVAGE